MHVNQQVNIKHLRAKFLLIAKTHVKPQADIKHLRAKS